MRLSTFALLIIILTIAHSSVEAKKKHGKNGKGDSDSVSIEDTVEGCVCEDSHLKPVCGSNEKTYKNKCIFECAQENAKTKKEKRISLRNKGACGKPTKDKTDDHDEKGGLINVG